MVDGGLLGQAFWWGIVSAVSLPLGAALGLWLKPKRKATSRLMAFGAGALLFALTIELFGHVPHHVDTHGVKVVLVTVLAAFAGGVTFDALNNLLSRQGAYMRRLSHARRHVGRLKLKRAVKLAAELNRIPMLARMKPEDMSQLILGARPRQFRPGQHIFRRDDPARAIYFILSGRVSIDRGSGNGKSARTLTLKPNDTFGEIAMLRRNPHTADARALTPVRLYEISREHFDEILAASPELQAGLQELVDSRADSYEFKKRGAANKARRDDTAAHLKHSAFHISVQDILEETRSGTGTGVAVAIWLGILIDGIPESLVIGMLAVGSGGISLAFIVGVFLANLPEAMSSAVSMRHGGLSLARIFLMWTSICVMTGLGALLGATIIEAELIGGMEFAMIAAEAFAGGAMLTMIAETMLPEAFEQGGAIVGLSTLAGFLATLVVKVL